MASGTATLTVTGASQSLARPPTSPLTLFPAPRPGRTASPRSTTCASRSGSARRRARAASTRASPSRPTRSPRTSASSLSLYRRLARLAPADPRLAAHRHLQIVLFDAERCWAHSQQLKSTLDDPATPPATKHLFAKRLTKASSHAAELLALVQSPDLASRLSAAHVAQVQAYALVQRGTVAFERNKHADGLAALSAAFEVLARIAETAPSATDEALANELMDEVEPMLRFCAYRLGLDTASGVASIAKDVAGRDMGALVPEWDALSAKLGAEGQPGARESVEIRWRGEVVPVRNAELVGPALKVQDALASLREDEQRSGSKGGEGAQGKRKAAGQGQGGKKEILVLSDAEAVAHQLVEDNQVRS